jgi:NitT/TauT family transport system ATP-binding protein
MTSRPGVIKTIVDIPISKEKRYTEDIKSTQEFAKIRHELWELLKEEVVKSQETCNKCSVEDCRVVSDDKIKEVD